jgi:hypothetical protein
MFPNGISETSFTTLVGTCAGRRKNGQTGATQRTYAPTRDARSIGSAAGTTFSPN